MGRKSRKLRATWVRDNETGKSTQYPTLDDYGMTAGIFHKLVEIDGEEVEVVGDVKNGTFVRKEKA